MKLGVIHFGPLTAGSHQIIQTVVEYCLTKSISLSGIKWNQTTNDVELKELNNDSILKWVNEREVMLNSLPIDKIKHQAKLIKLIDQFDSLVVLGGNRELVDFIIGNTKSNILTVPISIINDFIGTELSLGYDSALNVIVNNILKIQDTIDSLKYGKLRVFCTQIPGVLYNSLLEDVSIAVKGQLIYKPNEMFWENLATTLKDRYDKGITYSMLVVNEEIDPNEVHRRLSEKLDIDFKWNYIDESQCVGPFPTAIDRLLAVKFSDTIISWLSARGKSSHILVKNNRVIVEDSQK
ncbi:6-phosphofructokinase [Fredinandcohnia humi]